jgi:alginate O-acetyltransferase complex protein AlgI
MASTDQPSQPAQSRTPSVPSASPRPARPTRRSDRRFLVVWAILVGGLLVAAATSKLLSLGQWLALFLFLYFVPFKIAALIGLEPAERRQWTWRRLLAFFLWIGLQPRPFLLSHEPTGKEPRPTWRGLLLNLLTGAVFLWGVPWLYPHESPLLLRAWTGLVGLAFLRLLAGFDFWVLIFRLIGFPVEKVFVNPMAATSLRDFWGRRWNRIMSSMLRDLLFQPLSRRIGVIAATAVVFLYSGVVHEFVSVLAQDNYGGPTLYFLIQGAAFLAEGSRLGRRVLLGPPLVARCWTALVVIGPVALVVPPTFLERVIVPLLQEAQVPGL